MYSSIPIRKLTEYIDEQKSKGRALFTTYTSIYTRAAVDTAHLLAS